MPHSEAPSAEQPLAERVEERTIGPCRLLMLKTPVDSVVTWRGSFHAYPDFADSEDLVQDVTVSLLDKGTQHRDRFAIADVLENRGAQLGFNGKGYRIRCRGRALREDVPEVLEVMAEQLKEPLLDPTEFQKAKAQTAASLQRSMENTGAQAAAALARCLYAPDHPNYQPDPAAQIEDLQALTPEHVRNYHAQHFGTNRLILVFVGDINPAAIEELVAEHFGSWGGHQAAPRFGTEGTGRSPEQVDVPMPDKNNIDVRLGHGLSVRRQDDDYVPLYIANYILGGNFSARLMATIRDEQGLTYGIGSRLSGIATDYEGHWQVSVTLSRENLEKGVDATREQVRRFVEEGATDDELQEKTTTVTGSFKVNLATTGGLAEALLRNAQRDFAVAYLDRFPDKVRDVTLDQLNETMRRHIHPDRLHVARAGLLEMPEHAAAS